MSTTTAKLTYKAWLAMPETKRRYEIEDGVLEFMSPSPTAATHQRILRNFFLAMNTFVTERKLGEVLFAPFDLIISRKRLSVRQPDLIFVSNARLDIIKDQVEGAPDLAVEILSPANTPRKLKAKLEDYARIAIPEVWVGAPISKSLEVLALKQGKYHSAGICSAGSPVSSSVLEGFILPKRVFEC